MIEAWLAAGPSRARSWLRHNPTSNWVGSAFKCPLASTALGDRVSGESRGVVLVPFG